MSAARQVMASRNYGAVEERLAGGPAGMWKPEDKSRFGDSLGDAVAVANWCRNFPGPYVSQRRRRPQF